MIGDGRDPDVEGPALARLGRFALRPARAAARTGKSALTDEVERAIDGALASPLPEAVARSVVQHRVAQRILPELLEASDDGEIDRLLEQVLESPALDSWLFGAGSRVVERTAESVVRSPAFRQSLMEILASPELRHALTHQTAGFGSEVAAGLRGRAHSIDSAATTDRRARGSGPFAGVATRALGLAVDLVLAQLLVIVVGAMIGLVADLFGQLRPASLVQALAGAGWLIVVVAYFVLFWSATGQTPGARLAGVRVVTASGGTPSFWRALVRAAGLALAIIPCFAGFLPVLVDHQRRALQDFLAGTRVVYEPRPDAG